MVNRNNTCRALDTFSGSSTSSIPNWIDGRETASEEGAINPKNNVPVNISIRINTSSIMSELELYNTTNY